jgi:hypothetical protein
MKGSKFIKFYAVLLTLLTFAYVSYASFFFQFNDPDNAVRIIDTAVGFLFGVGFASVIAFFFGSSEGSKAKDGILAENRRTGGQGVPPDGEGKEPGVQDRG